MQEQQTIKLAIPATADYIDLARLTLYGVANKMGFSYEDIEDMKVAVAEACNNAVLHAYPEGETGTVDLAYEMSENGLAIHIRDHGTSFSYEEPAADLAPNAQQELADISVGGLGIYLMQALMDEVVVTNDEGTHVTLIKYLQTAASRHNGYQGI
nr:anti-sigma B factor RsbW [Gorillibacterium massiliense]